MPEFQHGELVRGSPAVASRAKLIQKQTDSEKTLSIEIGEL
jgi:hypothetical protein